MSKMQNTFVRSGRNRRSRSRHRRHPGMIGGRAVTFAGWIFTALIVVVLGFQLALVAGAPWGHLTQGGVHMGTLPPANRAIAAASALVLVAINTIVLIGAGIVLPRLRATVRPWIWAAVAFSGLSAVANAATTSSAERALWLPVTLLLLGASLVVALRNR